MPRVMVSLRLSEAEQALLARRAKKRGQSEADYLRVCMVMDSIIDGDLGAVKILSDSSRMKLAECFSVQPGDKLKKAMLRD